MWGRSLTLGDDATKHLPRPRAPRPAPRSPVVDGLGAFGGNHDTIEVICSRIGCCSEHCRRFGWSSCCRRNLLCLLQHDLPDLRSNRFGPVLSRRRRWLAGLDDPMGIKSGLLRDEYGGQYCPGGGIQRISLGKTLRHSALGNGVGTTWGDTYPWAN